MSNPIIHINRKFHVPLQSIISVTQKKWGRVWVCYIEQKTKQKRVAIAKQDAGTILNIINGYLIMGGKKPLILIK
jgi:hypothetical protein